ncbi:ABC transporter permease [uncultured Methanobrevibacter sp.]|uniref:ABC transporter permease n=1 Tax=uncultured Methanobrevibacter sp. TaxID=253161 RepID=UPI0025E48FA2|nr:ABC transporter permease [uncultured Methanobrevibacter sp.]
MSGNMHRFMTNFKSYKFLLTELIKKDVQSKYKDSVLGLFWSFLNPLLQMIVLTIVFSTFFSRSIPNFPVYLLTGRLILDLFAKGTSGAMTSIKINKAIVQKIYVPKYMFPLGSICAEFINYLISLIVLVLVMIVTGQEFYFTIIYAVIPIFLVLILTIGVGLILTTLATYFTDINYLWKVVTMMLTYLSAVFYPIDIVPKRFLIFFKLNPIYSAIASCRACILYDSFPEIKMLLYLAACAFISLILGLIIFYKYQDEFILRI